MRGGLPVWTPKGSVKHQRPHSPRSRLSRHVFPGSVLLITKPTTSHKRSRCLRSASNQSIETLPPSSQTGSHRANGQVEQHGNLRIPHTLTQTQLYNLTLMERQPLEVRGRLAPHGISGGPMYRMGLHRGRALTTANLQNVALNN